MAVAAHLQKDRTKTNPVFNSRKLKLGTFGTNLDRGCAISTIDGVLATLDQNNHALAVQIAAVPESMRGFGHVKEKNVAAAKAREASLLCDALPQPAGEAAEDGHLS